MLEKVPIAFLAGLLSVVTPCVLPLVPGYLSAISAVEVDLHSDQVMKIDLVILQRLELLERHEQIPSPQQLGSITISKLGKLYDESTFECSRFVDN